MKLGGRSLDLPGLFLFSGWRLLQLGPGGRDLGGFPALVENVQEVALGYGRQLVKHVVGYAVSTWCPSFPDFGDRRL